MIQRFPYGRIRCRTNSRSERGSRMNCWIGDHRFVGSMAGGISSGVSGAVSTRRGACEKAPRYLVRSGVSRF